MPEAVATAPAPVAAPASEAKPPVEAKPAAPAAKPAEAAPSAGLLGAEQKPTEAGQAPGAVAYDFKLPEGATVNDELMGQFKTVAGELKIPADKAQALVELGLKLQEQQAEAINQAWQEERAAGVERLKADPDFGGAKFTKTVEDANRALRQFGDAAFIQEIQELGLDNHPGLIKAFARVARATAEDRSIERPAGGIAGAGKSLGEVLYGKA